MQHCIRGLSIQPNSKSLSYIAAFDYPPIMPIDTPRLRRRERHHSFIRSITKMNDILSLDSVTRVTLRILQPGSA